MNNRRVIAIILGIVFAPFILQFLIGILIVLFIINISNPISETVVCNGIACETEGRLLLGTIGQSQTAKVYDKRALEIQTVSDFMGIDQYYIRMSSDPERYIFRSSYLIRKNAERDLTRIQSSDTVRITKRNTVFIQILCISLYIVLLIIGAIVRRIQQFRDNENNNMINRSIERHIRRHGE